MLLLCKVTTIPNIGTTLTLTDRKFKSMAEFETALRKHPEEFEPGKLYTLHEKRPHKGIKEDRQFRIFEG